ncbi:MAG: DEAD/DEAH box helicase [Armatimonadota bacterium]
MALDVDELLRRLQRQSSYRDQLVHAERIPARSARYADLEPALPPALRARLSAEGIDRLWGHQAEAIDLVRAGFPVVVTTPTASGKSLCYNAPVLESLLLDPAARALYLFPTKALAQDQSGKLRELDLFPEVVHATYDGDTPKEERSGIRRMARIVLTNPDMLHHGILPNHTTWSVFLRNLRYVVVDEAHVYRGVFGGHVGDILRRLTRIARRYGAQPQWIACSATIANPAEHLRCLTGCPTGFEVVANDGAPAGRRTFVFWNPPERNGSGGGRRSTHGESTDLFATLVSSGIRTIAFARARKSTELLLTHARTALESTISSQEAAGRIMSYRAGYTPGQRREIERRLFDGELIGVTATNALELGVDIGGMDAVVMSGYPGTVASAWQQAGRAGRRSDESLAVLVAADNPLDQFLMRRPDWFFASGHEHATADPANRHVLSGHLLCAAYEAPLTEDELDFFGGERALRCVKRLVEDGRLAWRDDRILYVGSEPPAPSINIRSASANPTLITLPDGAVLGTVEEERVFEQVHPGAVYLHMGEAYVVDSLDLAGRRARVRPHDGGYHTEPRTDGSIEIIAEHSRKDLGDTQVVFGEVRVTSRVLGYRRRGVHGEENLGEVDLDLPERTFETEAVWYEVPAGAVRDLERRKLDLGGSVHALEHAAIGLLPLFAMCDRNDIGGVSSPWHPQVGGPAVFVHDGHPGGVGIAETGFRLVRAWLEATSALIEGCGCDDGCPACIQSPKCGNNNQPLDKAGAARVLRALLKERPE